MLRLGWGRNTPTELIIQCYVWKFVIVCETLQFKMIYIYALGEVHKYASTPSFKISSRVTFESVPIFTWLTMTISSPFKEDRLTKPLSTPLSSRRSMVWCPWLCARRLCLKFLYTSDLPKRKHLSRLLFPPIHLLGHFPSLRHVQSSTPKGVSAGGCPALTRAQSCQYRLPTVRQGDGACTRKYIWRKERSAAHERLISYNKKQATNKQSKNMPMPRKDN